MSTKRIECEEIAVSSPQGPGGITLRVTEAGPEVVLKDQSGRKRILLTIADDVPMVRLYGNSEPAVTTIAMTSDASQLTLCDSEGRACTPLAVVDYKQWELIWKRLISLEETRQ